MPARLARQDEVVDRKAPVTFAALGEHPRRVVVVTWYGAGGELALAAGGVDRDRCGRYQGRRLLGLDPDHAEQVVCSPCGVGEAIAPFGNLEADDAGAAQNVGGERE